MDPATIFQVVGTALSLGDIAIKSIQRLSSLRSRYQDAPMVLTTMIGQLETVKSAVEQLDEFRRLQYSQHPNYERLSQRIDNSINRVVESMSSLETRLDKFDATERTNMRFRGRLTFMWSEEEMLDVSNLLNVQVTSLHLLILSAVQYQTWQQKSEPAHEDESIRIRDYTTSIIGLDDSAKSFVSESTQAISCKFEFDMMILNSKVYQRARRSHLRKAIKFDNLEAPAPLIEPPVVSTLGDTSDGNIDLGHAFSENTVLSVSEIAEGPLSEPSDAASVLHRPLATIKPSGVSDSYNGDSQSQQLSDHVSDHDAIDGVIQHQSEPNSPIWQRKRFRLSEWWRTPYIPQHASTNDDPFHRRSETCKDLTINIPMHTLHVASADNSELPRIMKSILVGTSESGKSTIFNAVKIYLKKIDVDSRRFEIHQEIWFSIVKSTRMVLESMMSLGISFNDPNLNDHTHAIFVQPHDYERPPDARLCHAIRSLWSNSGFLGAYKQTARHHPSLDNAMYFAKAAERIIAPDYRPTEQDIIYSMKKTVGLEGLDFEFRGLLWELFDFGGMKSERRKWIRTFESVRTIIFTIDVKCYSKTLDGSNCMKDQFKLFQSIATNQRFKRTGFVIVLTKCDRLKRWIRLNPPQDYLEDYDVNSGGSGTEQYLRYLERQVRNLDPWKDCVGRYRFLRVRFDNIEANNPAEAVLEAMLQMRRSWYYL